MYDGVTCLRLHQRCGWSRRLVEDALFARGMLLHTYTRIYFDGEPANATGPVAELLDCFVAAQ